MSKNKVEMFQDEMDLMPLLAIAVVDVKEEIHYPAGQEATGQRRVDSCMSPDGGDFV